MLSSPESSSDGGATAIQVALYQPEIPQNTGNIGRLCAYTGSRLHLIHPLGFRLDEKQIRRSGMDYWKSLDLVEHRDWREFKSHNGESWLLTTRGTRFHWDIDFKFGDCLLFGNEGHGVSDEIHSEIPEERKLKIPQLGNEMRSLNLATSVGIVVYEALRKIKDESLLNLS